MGGREVGRYRLPAVGEVLMLLYGSYTAPRRAGSAHSHIFV